MRPLCSGSLLCRAAEMDKSLGLLRHVYSLLQKEWKPNQRDFSFVYIYICKDCSLCVQCTEADCSDDNKTIFDVTDRYELPSLLVFDPVERMAIEIHD